MNLRVKHVYRMMRTTDFNRFGTGKGDNKFGYFKILQRKHILDGSRVGKSGGIGSESTSSPMQKFWDSATALPLDDDYDSRSEGSTKFTYEGTQMGRLASYPHLSLSNNFGFKFEDKKGRMHRFNCETQSITNLVTSILQRVGDDIDRDHLPEILYEDTEHDKVLLASDSNLVATVEHARLSGCQSLRLHLDYSGSGVQKRGGRSGSFDVSHKDAWAYAYSTVTE